MVTAVPRRCRPETAAAVRADSGSAGGGGGGDLLHQPRLAPSRLVLVDDALGGGHVEALDGEADGLVGLVGAGGRGRRLDAGLQLALGGLVAIGPLGVGDVALLLALDVRHGSSYGLLPAQ